MKTSTGFSTGGATAEDVALMRRVVGRDMGVKAAGGVRDLKSAQQMIEAGADRIGASVGVKIVQESKGTAPPTLRLLIFINPDAADEACRVEPRC